jgi:ABC-type enterochelin transport system ATPase subunit
MAKIYPKGSEWRKWDLHFHTPSSYDYSNQSVTNQEIVDTLISNGIAVVAITDHHIIDIPRITELRRLAEESILGDITILPGIEFLSDTRGSDPLHFIGIFSEDADLEYIWGQLENRTKLIEVKTRVKNINAAYCDYEETVNLIHSLGGIVSVHAGSKTNGLVGITNSLPHTMAQKTDISHMADIFDMGQERDLAAYESIVFPAIKKELPMVMCSDNHNIIDYTTKQNCWIKADPSFHGLLQIIYEPSERVRIQEHNPNFDFEKSPFTDIEIKARTAVFNDPTDNIHLEQCNIPLNSNLISIIGGRGTGKSILVDYIARGFGKDNTKEYMDSRSVSVYRQTSLRERTQEFNLGDRPNVPFLYISQSQIKELVSDKVRFTRNIRETIGVTDEYTPTQEYIEIAEKVFNEYFRIVKILDANNTDSETKKKAISAEIKKYTDFIANVTSEENKPKLSNYQTVVRKLEKITFWFSRINKLKHSIATSRDNINEEIISINGELGGKYSIPSLNTDSALQYIDRVLLPGIETKKQAAEQEISTTKAAFGDFHGDLGTLLSNVGEYQNKVSALERELNTIIGEEGRFEEIRTSWFRELGIHIKGSIDEYTTLISTKWQKFKDGYEGMRPEMKGLLAAILNHDEIDVIVNIRFDKDAMYERLLEKLDKRSYNIDRLKECLQIHTIDDYFNFIQQVPDHPNIFSESITPIVRGFALDLFFKRYNTFISHEIVVTSKGKPITKLSHGQQGTIFLRLQLASRAFSETIIYDQPEDDLDNDFIMRDLVEIFRKIKRYRQVIIVSHNANLVVNADSEQIIIAENVDGVLNYISGSLENPIINDRICAILEGGKNAFLCREQKYQLNAPVVFC